ncbi:MAG TPA: tetratricopeptide repeat protein [Herbaspirillum sp.]|jgi:tetratricopeptide (TPR) repeat protein|nr:tetratricopeptide repeat protein [Herbaspirillum sp.]
MKSRYTLIALCLLSCGAAAAETPMPEMVAGIAHRWATINYQDPEKDRESEFNNLAGQAEQIAKNNPGKAEPMIWQAIVLASEAKVEGGLGALSKVKQARDLLLAAEKIDPNALNGSVYTSLGSLYAKVPGWPIGFGDSGKARAYLEMALKINPNGIDSHYFYADFLNAKGEYSKAMDHLNQALAAPPRPGREDADAGRRKEVETLMAEIRAKHGDQLVTK